MAKVSAKRQITLPIDQCTVAQIQPGDEVETYVDRQGVISIVKKRAGAAKGILKGIKVNAAVSEAQSLQTGIE